MGTKKVSSDQARTGWREMLDAVASGDTIIIERYGKPVAVLSAYQDFEEGTPLADDEGDMVREKTAVYQSNEWKALKSQLAAEIKADLLTEPDIQHALLQYERWQLQKHELAHLEEEFANYEQRYPFAHIRD
jgi:antitoxin (DNA-binding transcriptional repressor) of toxin-antitoxin stability system